MPIGGKDIEKSMSFEKDRKMINKKFEKGPNQSSSTERAKD
tara:strand:+ start:964 stop:1086 length:123 start_codon:yes stop_codon:yes gene_type:complete